MILLFCLICFLVAIGGLYLAYRTSDDGYIGHGTRRGRQRLNKINSAKSLVLNQKVENPLLAFLTLNDIKWLKERDWNPSGSAAERLMLQGLPIGTTVFISANGHKTYKIPGDQTANEIRTGNPAENIKINPNGTIKISVSDIRANDLDLLRVE